jgi:hypothetical protein
MYNIHISLTCASIANHRSLDTQTEQCAAKLVRVRDIFSCCDEGRNSHSNHIRIDDTNLGGNQSLQFPTISISSLRKIARTKHALTNAHIDNK